MLGFGLCGSSFVERAFHTLLFARHTFLQRVKSSMSTCFVSSAALELLSNDSTCPRGNANASRLFRVRIGSKRDEKHDTGMQLFQRDNCAATWHEHR